MNPARQERYARRNEGCSLVPYRDILGIWTIGYGSTRIDGRAVTENTRRIDQRKALEMLKADLFEAHKTAYKLFPNLAEIGSVRAEVLVDMAYNLGHTRLFNFFRLRMAVAAQDWATAAAEIQDSKYFRQVGLRGKRNRNAMHTGSWAA